MSRRRAEEAGDDVDEGYEEDKFFRLRADPDSDDPRPSQLEISWKNWPLSTATWGDLGAYAASGRWKERLTRSGFALALITDIPLQEGD